MSTMLKQSRGSANDVAAVGLTPVSEPESATCGVAPTIEGRVRGQDADAVVPAILCVVQPMDRAEAIRRGHSPERATIKVDLSALSVDDRALMAPRVREDAHGRLIARDRFDHDLKLHEPTPAGLLDALRRDEAARVEAEREREARIEEAIERLRQAKDEDILEHWSVYEDLPSKSYWYLGYDKRTQDQIVHAGLGDRLDTLRKLRAEQRAAAKVEAERCREEAKARREEAEARKRAKAEQERAEREAWITAHGSRRLRRLLAERIEHRGVYLDERLALERPGWEWHSMPGASDGPRNAPTEALDLLDEARASVPEDERETVRLVHWTVKLDGGDDDYYDYDHHEEPETVSGYTCEATFLDHDIVYRVADDGTPPVVVK